MRPDTFFARLNRAANRGGRLVLVGRGPSSRFLDTDALGAEDLLVGYNLPELHERPVDIVYSTRREEQPPAPIQVLSLEALREHADPDRPLLRVGSIGFGLGELLVAIERHIDRPLTALLFGFDFRAATPDDDILKSSRGLDTMQRQIDVNAQRDIFFKLRPLFERLKLVHAGFDRESDADPRHALAESLADAPSAVEVVAEITTNHFGDRERLDLLIRGAAAAGADSIKLQARDVERFHTEDKLSEPYRSPFGHTYREYRHALELDDASIVGARDLAAELGMGTFFSALDRPSFERLRDLGFTRLKLPSTISEHRAYLQWAAEQQLPELVISTGMTDEHFERFVLETFRDQPRLYLLHCVSSYPTAPNATNIAVVRHYRDLAREHRNLVPGYSSHDIGSFGCALAVAAGAMMIEKHVKIGSTSWAHFDDTALDVQHELPDFVRTVRAAERVCGAERKRVQPTEHHKYAVATGPHAE